MTFALHAIHPHWLYAGLIDEDLIVYRSTLVRDTDAIYAPIKELLNQTHHRIRSSDLVPDEQMMFGEAVLTIYQLGET